MKKILALALAIVMMASITVTSFAAILDDETGDIVGTRYGDGNDDNTEANYLTDAADSQTEGTRIEYGVAQAYTVTIPADVRLNEYHGTDAEQTVGYVYGIEALGVSDVVVAGNEKICIYLSSTQYDSAKGGWRMIDTEGENGAKISADVNYKIVAKDGDADATQYLTEAEYDSTTGIVSGTDNTTAGSLILTQDRATGNAGTTGSEKNINLYFSSKGTAQEGTYKDVLTFTVRIETDTAITGDQARA